MKKLKKVIKCQIDTWFCLFILCLIPDGPALKFEPHLSGSKVQALFPTPDRCQVSESWWNNLLGRGSQSRGRVQNVRKLLFLEHRHPIPALDQASRWMWPYIPHLFYLVMSYYMSGPAVGSGDKAVNMLNKDLCLHGACNWMERWVSHTNYYNVNQKTALEKQKHLQFWSKEDNVCSGWGWGARRTFLDERIFKSRFHYAHLSNGDNRLYFTGLLWE